MEYVVGHVWIEWLNPWWGLDAKCRKLIFNRCDIATLSLSRAVPVAFLVFHRFSFGGALQFETQSQAVGLARPPHFCSVTMTRYDNRKGPICSKIYSLLALLTNEPSKYDELAPKIEYWIEYVICEQFVTIDELVEKVSEVAWEGGGSLTGVVRFLKEFQDAPHRPGQAKSFVAQLCTYILRWFAIACAEDFSMKWHGSIWSRWGPSFIRAASFVGYLVEWGLLEHDLVQRHLIKSLTHHQYSPGDKDSAEAVRASAIYQLFITAGNTLLQGLLGPEDVQVCFGILDTRREWIQGFKPAKLQVLCSVPLTFTFEFDLCTGIPRGPRSMDAAQRR